MAVELRVRVADEPRVGLRKERGAALEAEVPAPSRLGASIGGGVRMRAEVQAQPSLAVSSDAVAVPPSGDTFHGPYVLTPTLAGFDVATEGLYMSDDVTVEPIPISDVANPYDGRTVTIG